MKPQWRWAKVRALEKPRRVLELCFFRYDGPRRVITRRRAANQR